MNKLKGKIAIITGASRGIGLSIAQVLHNEGVKVYDISKSLTHHDFIAKGFQADINDYQKVKEIFEEIFAIEGKIDIFVNNAGFGIAGAIEYANPENIYKQIDTNLAAYIVLSSIAIKYLKKSGGNIINISSVGGIIPLPYQATYSATKAGIEIFSRALANEVKQYKIHVTAILPGDTKTGFTASRVIDNEVEDKTQQESIRLSIAKVEKDEQKGMSPESVAKVVKKVLKKKHPPLRATVGFAYKLVAVLPRLLTLKTINFIVRKMYCKNKKTK